MTPFVPVGSIVRDILAAAAAIHDELGPGFDVVIYRVALEHDLVDRGLVAVSNGKLLVVDQRVAIEVRGAGGPHDDDVEGLRAIVQSVDLTLALRLDFDAPTMLAGVRRVFADDDPTTDAA